MSLDGGVDDQPVLLIDEFLSRRARDLVLGSHQQRFRRASLHAEPTENATQVIDLVDLRVSLAWREPLLGRVLRTYDVDGVGGACPGAKLAPNAFFEAVGVTIEDVAPLEPRPGLPPHLRISHRLLLAKNVGDNHL